MKRYELLTVLLLILCFWAGAARDGQEALAERISPAVLRLHILADSDKEKIRPSSWRSAVWFWTVCVTVCHPAAAKTKQSAGSGRTAPVSSRRRMRCWSAADFLTAQSLRWCMIISLRVHTQDCVFPAGTMMRCGSSSAADAATTGGAFSILSSVLWNGRLHRHPG